MYCPICKYEYRNGFSECSDCKVKLVNSLDRNEPAILIKGTSIKKCPNCNLVNPEIVQKCDCYYNFKKEKIKQSYIENYQPEKKVNKHTIIITCSIISLIIFGTIFFDKLLSKSILYISEKILSPFGVILLVIFSLIFGVARFIHYRIIDRNLDTRGIPTKATITAIHKIYATEDIPPGFSSEIEFHDKSNNLIKGTLVQYCSSEATEKVGDKIPIVYDSLNPEIFRREIETKYKESLRDSTFGRIISFLITHTSHNKNVL